MTAAGGTRTSGTIEFGPFRLIEQERRLERDGQAIKIGSRALDLLLALVERVGEVVCKEELIARLWPDTTVEGSGIRVHVAALRKALGGGQQGKSYVTNVPGRGYRFVVPISHSSRSASLVAPETVAHETRLNLPTRVERIVGREETIAEIEERLSTSRFVTIVGPGGMGKTTVAVAVAHATRSDFEEHVYFVDLASVTDARHASASVASALGLPPLADDDATSSIVAFLRDRRVALVLDSCEHVIATVAPLAERIFEDALRVHILATSRESLRVRGEHVHRLEPLKSPICGQALTIADALTFPAVQLFVERAMAGGARLALSDNDAPVIAEICGMLDGVALAIELAASRVAAHGIRGTAELLQNRFGLRWLGRRTALPRHQTLSAMLDWSYDLLDEFERMLLRRLSIFVGGFSLDAVAAVAGGEEMDGDRAVDILGSLVEKSLISLDRGGPAVRYRLLDTMRAYAQGKLDAAQERHATARRHALYLCDLLDSDGGHAFAEHVGNARAALKWSFSDLGDTMVGASLAALLAPTFMDLALLHECHRRVDLALAALSDADRGTRREMQLQAALGLSMMFSRGNSREVQTALTRGLALGEELDDPYPQLRLLGALHLSLYRFGDFREALSVAERSKDVAKRLKDPTASLLADWMIGTTHHLLGSQIEAERLCKTALAPPLLSERMAMVHWGFDPRIRALVILGRALWLVGHPEDARRVATQTVREATEGGQPATLASAFVWTSSVFLWSSDWGAAEQIIDQLTAYAEKHALGPYHDAVVLGLRGELAVKRGAAGAGVELLRRSIEVLRAENQQMLQTVFATALAEGLGLVGQHDEALVTVDHAIAATSRNGGSFDLPEMLRIRGELLATQPAPDEVQAEHFLVRAIDCAKDQGALGWELRAASNLARLWCKQGRRADARQLLSACYDRFSQGFQTADLLAAKQLLSEL